MSNRWVLFIFSAVFLVGLSFNFVASVYLSDQIREKENLSFKNASEKLYSSLEMTVKKQEQALRILSANLSNHQRPISEELFSRLVYGARLPSEYPFALGFGYLEKLKNGGIKHVAYFEPSESAVQGIGFDGKNNSQIIEAANWSSSRGVPTITGKSQALVDKEDFSTIVFVFPVYKGGVIPQTEADRLALTTGWVYIPILSQEVFKKVLAQTSVDDFDFHIYDGAKSEESLIFDSTGLRKDKKQSSYDDTKEQKLTSVIQFGNRFWTLDLMYLPSSEETMLRRVPDLIMVTGLFVIIFFGLYIRSSLLTQDRAKYLAEQLTAEMHSKHEELTTIIGSIPGRVSWFDSNLNYLGVNEELANAFGKKPREFVGKPIGWLGKSKESSSFLKMVYEFYDSGIERKIEYVVSGNDESTAKHFLTTLQRYDQGKGIMIVSLDITAQKVLEREVEQARAKAAHSARMSSLGEMAGGMAHEINNPLAIIFGKATFAKRMIARDKNNVDLAKLTESLEKIEQTADRIGKIIKGLRTIARDGENDPFERTPVQNIVNDVVELCRSRLANNNVQFTFSQVAPDVMLECRSTQIVQVLLNLINNAYDAIEKLDEKWIRLEVNIDTRVVEFSVVDCGKGIPNDVVMKMMQPFYTTKDIGKGTGLGLSISRSIAQAHKGLFTYDRMSPNTKFTLKLPREQAFVQMAA